MSDIIPEEIIRDRIFLIRGCKVMLDKDLAKLYGVKTKVLNQSVKRNNERFPEDFMFPLTREEILRMSQFVTSLGDNDALKYYKNVNAFTENGVAMLSSVLRSKRAIRVNILIMRTFTKIRKLLANHKEIELKFNDLAGKVDKHDKDIQLIFKAIKQLLSPPPTEKKYKIGFLR